MLNNRCLKKYIIKIKILFFTDNIMNQIENKTMPDINPIVIPVKEPIDTKSQY